MPTVFRLAPRLAVAVVALLTVIVARAADPQPAAEPEIEGCLVSMI